MRPVQFLKPNISSGIDGHSGYDWLMPEGTPLVAAAPGIVLVAGADSPSFCPPLDRNVEDQIFVEIEHAQSWAEDEAGGAIIDVAFL